MTGASFTARVWTSFHSTRRAEDGASTSGAGGAALRRRPPPHVFQHCLPVSAPRNHRHNGVVRLLAGAVQPDTWTVEVDRTTPGASTSQRVDLQFTRRSTGDRLFIDVKIPFERPAAVDQAGKRNAEKYAELAAEAGADLDTFIVGAYGSWRPENDRLLRRLGVAQPASLRDTIIRHVVHWSRNIYTHFVTGVAQTF